MSREGYRWTPGTRVPLVEIRRIARQVADRLRPDKIILFGSYAYGAPRGDSDVDVLVIMPTSNELNAAVRVRRKTDHPFPLDVIVRTPGNLHHRLEQGDWFLREIVAKGKVLYEKPSGMRASKQEFGNEKKGLAAAHCRCFS